MPPEKWGLGFVFQDFALWPHMSVFENVAFGPRASGGTSEIKKFFQFFCLFIVISTPFGLLSSAFRKHCFRMSHAGLWLFVWPKALPQKGYNGFLFLMQPLMRANHILWQPLLSKNRTAVNKGQRRPSGPLTVERPFPAAGASAGWSITGPKNFALSTVEGSML